MLYWKTPREPDWGSLVGHRALSTKLLFVHVVVISNDLGNGDLGHG